MRKRQVKKFAKNARQNMKPYRQALAACPGSKRLARRKAAFLRLVSRDARESRRQLEGLARITRKLQACLGGESVDAARRDVELVSLVSAFVDLTSHFESRS